MTDDRPPDDADYPRQSSRIVLWSPSKDAAEEIIQIGRRVCDEPVSVRF